MHRQAEVEQLGCVRSRDDNVLRFDIAMENAGVMRVLQRLEKAPGNRERLCEGDRSLDETSPKRYTFDKLHRDKRFTRVLTCLVERGYRGMLQLRTGLCFTQ